MRLYIALSITDLMVAWMVQNEGYTLNSHNMTKCKGPHHDFDDFTTYDFTTFTTSRLLTDLETHFCTVNPVSISITSREVVKVVKS